MRDWLSKNGIPKYIYHDNGTEFKGDFEDLLKERGIKHIPGRTYHPQTQGNVEKTNGIFKTRLTCLRRERALPNDWVRLLPELREVLNIIPNRMLPAHVTPFEVWFGRRAYWISPSSKAEDPASEESEEELNADEDKETESLILSEIEKRVDEKNARTVARITQGNIVTAK